MYQNDTYGNDNEGVYPLFYNNPNHGLKVALFDFNIENLPSSFNATNFMEIGVISDNASIEWKQLDVTQAYLQAQNTVGFSDFPLMLYFDLITDYDYASDYIGINRASTSNPPNLTFRYHDTTPTYEGECEIAQTNLQCYPNPVSDFLSIKSDNSTNITQISIYNIKGQRVLTKETKHFSKGEISLNLPQNLASGIYFVKCKMDGNLQTITKKIFVK
ncbi:T9SS type A sorting domain-containing protein [bacterium]|nr:T9SS type A sorting domain-containing protein [bacterium]